MKKDIPHHQQEDVLLNKKTVLTIISRLAHEIIEMTPLLREVVFIGIVSGGVDIAEETAAAIMNYENIVVPVGKLDVSFYRDDLQLKREKVTVRETSIPCDINQKDIVFFDNVISSGRTIRAAMDAILDWGRPRSIQLAVLIDRDYREFPIQPNYIGKKVVTDRKDLIVTNLHSTDKAVVLLKNK